MKYADMDRLNDLETFKKEINETLEKINEQLLTEGLMTFNDVEHTFVQKTKFAYLYKNVGVYIGRKLTDKRPLTKIEALRLDKYIKQLLKTKFEHPIVKLLVKLLLPFLAITVLSVLAFGAGEITVASASTAMAYLAAKNILGFARFAVASGVGGYASSIFADQLAAHLLKIKDEVGSTINEYVNDNIGKSKFANILAKIMGLFASKNEDEKEDLEQSMAGA